jgi:2-iminobutanoate/2-iminopropanoate deaminase
MAATTQPTGAPEAIKPRGPYTSIVRAGNTVYLSGQGGFAASGEIVKGGIGQETRQTLNNVETQLRSIGASLSDLVTATCYLVDINDLADFNEAWQDYFGDTVPPARTTVAVASLPFGLRLEVTCQAQMDRI